MRAEAWQAVAQITALLAAAFGVWQYIDSRNLDRSWRKAEFLLKLAEDFDHDGLTRSALLLLENPSDLHGTLSDDSQTLDEVSLQKIHSLDRYFDFFDRLYTFVHVTTALDARDVMCFSGYLDVLDDEQLATFVKRRGYGNALILRKEVTEEVRKASLNAGLDDLQSYS